MRAPLAMIRPGYTPSSDPRETMMETFLILSGWSDITLSSNAAHRFRVTGNFRGFLDLTLREQRIKVFRRNAADFVHSAHAGYDPLFLEILVDELDHLPMGVGQGDSRFLRQCRREVAVPLRVIGQVTFFVDIDGDPVDLFLWHSLFLRLVHTAASTGEASVGIRLPTRLMRWPMPGRGKIGRAHV